MNRFRAGLRTGTALFAVALFGASLAASGIGSASAADSASVSVSDASLTWGPGDQDGGLLLDGTGTVEPGANTAALQWSGSVPSVFYDRLTYGTATDPSLHVQSDGTAALTATAKDYGTVTLANLHGVKVTATGFSVTPDNLADARGVTSGTAQASQAGGPAKLLTVAYSSVVTSTPTPSVGSSVTPTATPSITPTEAPTAPPTMTPAASTTVAPTVTPTVSPTTFHPTVSLADSSVIARGDLAFTAAGFRPFESVSLVVHSNPVTLAVAVADAHGVVSASRALPATVPAGLHSLILTGATSKTTASGNFTVTAPAQVTRATNSCQLTAGIKGGNLVWGFKKSFRSYVGGPVGNSITASAGATILNQDLALAGKPASGTYQWPFVSSSAYTAPSTFTVQYGGSVELKYPAHYFDIVISRPRLVVNGNTGTMYADVALTVTSPTAAPKVDSRAGVALASLNLSGSSVGATTAGITRTMHTAIQDTRAFTFDGSAFYQKGQQLDDAAVLLSGCVGTGAGGPATATGGSATGNTATGAPVVAGGGDSSLVPDVRFRPGTAAAADALPNTGINVGDWLAVAGLGVASGLLLIVAATRRRYHPAGEHQ